MRNSPTTVGCARRSTRRISPWARPSALNAADADHHAVAMHGARSGFLGDVDVALQSGNGNFGGDEGVAVAMDVETPRGVLAVGTHGHELA